MSWLRISLVAIGACSLAHAAPANGSSAKPNATQNSKKAEQFKSFTGRVAANKVRVRARPDLEGHIVRQANKDDLFLVVGEEGDFYAIQPPQETKAYVFRSYVIDDVVEASRVNVRLEPHVDGPIIGQLQAGDKVKGQVCAVNHKWLEVAPPPSTRFYVSKEFIAHAGGPEFIATRERRKNQVEEMLSAAYLAAENECKKAYEEMSPQPIIDQFQSITRQFNDFPNAVAQAKEGLALFKETYINKKIAYLEEKAQLSPAAKEELLAKHKEESRELLSNGSAPVDPNLFAKRAAKRNLSDAARPWDSIEESLYLSWSAFHAGKKVEDFYAEQRANATILTGRISTYDNPVKNKPGDFLLRGPEAPIAYLYSTAVDLAKYEGKQVTVAVSPRSNNHFAFPAYFVLSVE
jgi:hypothetical protein